MKIVTILGARPQFIKASVVSNEISRRQDVEEVVIHTGQHFDANMSDVFFSELGVATPRYDLGIHGGSHGEMTGRMLAAIEPLLVKEAPSLILVYGDTNSTLAGALAAVKLHIPVAHVEAGLRSFNTRMPEEVNRVLTDHVSTWLFAPTADAVRHLESEGLDGKAIHQVGDVMHDAALYYGARVGSLKSGAVQRLDLEGKAFVLCTVHRAENTNDRRRLGVIVEALMQVAEVLPVVWPLHPRTRIVLEQTGMLAMLRDAVTLVEPLSYLDMVQLERLADVIATDSGGVQKEAFFHHVPCVTLRDETEWVELVRAGWNRLVSPTDVLNVVTAILEARGTTGEAVYPYGRGGAANRIVDCVTST